MRHIIERHIGYNLTEHCNLRCYGCDHNSPVMPERLADLGRFRRDLEVLGTALHARILSLMGGEPLLHPELSSFLRTARELGIADRVAMLTNGLLLHRAPDQVWELLDAMLITRYPGVRLRMTDDEIAAKCRRHGIELRIEVARAFRVTILNQTIEDRALVQRIYDACGLAHQHGCRTVYEGRFYKCSPAPFIPERLRMLGRGEQVEAWEDDGVRIHDNPSLREELEAYLRSDRPLSACAACLGSAGVLREHQQMNDEACRSWLAEDHADVGRLLAPEHLVRLRGARTAPPDRTHETQYDSAHAQQPAAGTDDSRRGRG